MVVSSCPFDDVIDPLIVPGDKKGQYELTLLPPTHRLPQASPNAPFARY